MKRLFLLTIIALAAQISYAQEFKVITIVESIVPMGVGRSRIIETQDSSANVAALTTVRDGNKSNQKSVDRESVKESGENLKETKLLNFYSFAGINFGNIAANDAVISAKINALVKEGWTVAFVTSAVESDAGKDDGQGIFITRIFFKR